jgi:hypothetical protein
LRRLGPKEIITQQSEIFFKPGLEIFLNWLNLIQEAVGLM